jgi:hypothetical protein
MFEKMFRAERIHKQVNDAEDEKRRNEPISVELQGKQYDARGSSARREPEYVMLGESVLGLDHARLRPRRLRDCPPDTPIPA